MVAAASTVSAATVMQSGAGVLTVLVALVVGSTFESAAFMWGCISGLGVGVGMWLYYAGIQRSSSTLVAPISAAISALGPYVYAVLGGSSSSVLAASGAMLAVVGLVFVTGGAVSRERLVAGLFFGVVSGLVYAATTIAYIKAADSGGLGMWPVAGQRSVAGVSLLVMATVLGHKRSLPRSQTGNAISAAVLMTIVSVSLLAALAVDAAPASVAIATSPVFAVMIGRTFFADPLRPAQVVGIAMVVAGIAAVSVG